MGESDRPGICGQLSVRAELLASLIDQAPSRVRKRLDKDPAIAHAWTWTAEATCVTISTGDETVRLEVQTESKRVTQIDQVSCSCLLSPKCFHLLACVSCLPIETDAADSDNEVLQTQASQSEDVDEPSVIEITDAMRDAAGRCIDAIEWMLRSGARRCGVVLQSSLLRAAHQCRAAGLVHLSSAVLSVVEGVVRLRAQSGNTDVAQLQSDLARAVVLARCVLRQPSADLETIGQVRRSFEPVDVSRLVSLLAEPIVTRSGYAGVCVYLMADDGGVYQVSEVRPGEAELASQAYRGGFELGGTTISAFQLCRSDVDVQNMTASPDRRLGRGSKTRWAVRKQTAGPIDASPTWKKRFGRSLADQVDQLFAVQKSVGPTAAADNDFVAFGCQVLGRHEDAVLVKADDVSRPLRLRIALDTDQVPYRENLELLARSPGLELFVIGRVRRHQAGSIDALAIRVEARREESDDDPRLELPDSWRNVCQLGLDRLERHFFSRTDPEADAPSLAAAEDARGQTEPSVDGVAGLARQQLALVLGGRGSVASPASAGHRRMIRTLTRQMLPTAAKLADAVAAAAVAPESKVSDPGAEDDLPGLCDLLAASDRYQNMFRADYHRQAWNDWLS
ncbi:hypothetical protein Enr13x_76230 [Stieleria neptunia]|uniref:SWIM-type domain-containing protein n=1 Tax=Stieleria neptunia TaxID=2527979 RepID=A0A518I3N4_9BACT|nr:hypothetical protein [Stieleria neptunia]QDV47712.1 hypothetical protein Enr13x_76230 [Stieleria neptunia]